MLYQLSYTPAPAEPDRPPAAAPQGGCGTPRRALAKPPARRYLASLACIGKGAATGLPVPGGCPRNKRRRDRVARVNPGEFLRQVRAETGKVVWPTRRETMMTGLMVVIMTTLLGLFFFGVDSAFSAIVQALLGLLS